MEDLLTFPKRTRMPNLLLVGPTNNGKTMIVEKFRRAHPPIPASDTADGAANVAVLKVQMPAQIPLVAVGTAEAPHAVQSDDQLANRFEPVGLPPWRDGQEYQQLLSTLEAVLPLRRPSRLATPALAEKILTAAEGILGEVVSIVTRAAVRAVACGSESITAKLLDETVCCV